jgi:Gram-negative bacterial TonB protein C-terminal
MDSPVFYNHQNLRSIRRVVLAVLALVLGLIPVFSSQRVAAQQADAPKSPPVHAAGTKPPAVPDVPSIREEQLRAQLVGKMFYLRGGYLDNDLHFDEQGRLAGSSPQASYTLSMVQFDQVHLSKHRLELRGVRYGLHFLGARPTEDPLQASDKVRITPKKKFFRMSIERAEVVKSKKKAKPGKSDTVRPAAPPVLDPNQSLSQSAAAAESVPRVAAEDGNLMTQARANALLKEALDHIFSQGLDDRMIASMPDFWKLYYQSAAAKSDFRPSDPSILRQDAVDQKARLLTNFEPPSNDFAQIAGVAGLALYHVVISPDGKPAEIAVGRPIGFGLDENAVASILKASFQPAIKDGKPVPVLLDLLVQFRIFSKRTSAANSPDAATSEVSQSEGRSLPGPYSAAQPVTKQP